jgi:hypothetical protein
MRLSAKIPVGVAAADTRRRRRAHQRAASEDASRVSGLSQDPSGCWHTVLAMIDFSTQSVFKLAPCSPEEIVPQVAPILIEGEQVVASFKAVRDFVMFTNKRLVAVNVQGMTGKKRDFTSLPYSKIQAFSIETAGTFDLDAELDLWFSGLGKVRMEFRGRTDIRQLGDLIASYAL